MGKIATNNGQAEPLGLTRVCPRSWLNPKFAVENRLPNGAQSFRREDNALLPLSGLRSSVFYEPSLPL
jgi:hypothetical protein